MNKAKARFLNKQRQRQLGALVALAGLLILVSAMTSAWFTHSAQASQSPGLEVPANDRVTKSSVPIIIYATRADCGFCRLLEKEVLKPLMLSGKYAGQFTLLPLPLDEPQNVVKFAGKAVSASALVARYQLQLTPTLVFVDTQGSELAPRLIGYQSGAFYEHYLDQAIRKAGNRTPTQSQEDSNR